MERRLRAHAFLAQHGRDIDKALYNFHIGGGPLEALIEVLSRYQHPDGGFHSLEVDIQAPVSNPFATELALLIALQAGIPTHHPLLQKTVAHLEQTQDEEGSWRFAPEVYEHELAPWFQGWSWPTLNPTCTTAGLLKALGLGSPELHRRAEQSFARLASPDDLARDDFYAARPYAFFFLPEQPHPQRDFYLSGLLWWLIRQHVNGTSADAGHFFEYVRTPQSPMGRQLPPAILAAQLDRMEAEQADDGGWPSPYNANWRPWITVQNLLTLRDFGRLSVSEAEEPL